MDKKILIPVGIVFLLLVFIAIILTPVYKRGVVKVKKPLKGKIAIVIDDFGYSQSNLFIIEKIKHPLTCAVLPNLKNSRLIAGKLKNFGFEIILHLPMEPKEKYELESNGLLSNRQSHKLEKNTISLNMNETQVINILDVDLASVVFAKGVSNHMGSAITENKIIAKIVMDQVKKKNLYFLDSFVTADSVCAEIAQKIKIRFAKRNIFLDNQNDSLYIKNQLLKLKDLAAKHGEAIGIGHDRPNTLTVLKEMMPKLAKEGYKFVFVSELAR